MHCLEYFQCTVRFTATTSRNMNQYTNHCGECFFFYQNSKIIAMVHATAQHRHSWLETIKKNRILSFFRGIFLRHHDIVFARIWPVYCEKIGHSMRIQFSIYRTHPNGSTTCHIGYGWYTHQICIKMRCAVCTSKDSRQRRPWLIILLPSCVCMWDWARVSKKIYHAFVWNCLVLRQ